MSEDHEVTWQVQCFKVQALDFYLRNKKILEQSSQIKVKMSNLWNFKFSSSHIQSGEHMGN